MTIGSIILVPLIGAFIGWITNLLAVKMLFYPRREVRFLGLKIHGVFPRRQSLLAERLGDLVSSKLFSVDEVRSRINRDVLGDELGRILDTYLERALWERLPKAIPMLAMFLNPDMVKTIKDALKEDLPSVIDGVLDSVGTKLGTIIDIKEIVRDKVAKLSVESVEEMMLSIMEKEFKFIEVIGGVLGFLIGLVQVLVVEVGARW